VLAVRPYCHTDHYWQVYFDTNRLIREAFGEAGFRSSIFPFAAAQWQPRHPDFQIVDQLS
jgi:hypothetical protein